MLRKSRQAFSWPFKRLPISSLTIKLTLAFVLVGLIGAVLVALLIGQRTRSEFDRFRSERDQVALIDALADYYSARGSWDDVGAMLASTSPLDLYSRGIVIADASGTVVFGNGEYTLGEQVTSGPWNGGVPIQVNNQTIGFVLDAGRPAPNNGDGPVRNQLPPDVAFLQRVSWAATVSAGIAVLIALLLGTILARTLTRPIRELTSATQAMASGKLGQRVQVRSRDEVGELALSFNKMSADLAHASQMRKQMTADLAHDLRTPLSILRGYTEGLKDERLKGTPALFAIMHGEVEHLQRLVEDLGVLSLADAGELTLYRRAVDPVALLERTGLAYIVAAEDQGIGLRVDAPSSLPSIAVDTDRMTQVLNNLVSNALRYTTSGEIVLSAAAQKDSVALKVRDTGSGIAAEDLPLIFERFYRADKARQRADTNSSGLGLAIAKAIVEAHGGTIAVESVVGQGTCFTISVPLAQSPTDGGQDERHHDRQPERAPRETLARR